ncbi:hypothetical protein RHGRI_019324 [Rhododendron griersonianum]|uniref:Uncharacterized protein n=1 Tax=Rhododendron griersonianum TaxID=479676 RepID=A0AAV6JGL0_9ERIC|nr:hypothetical protein RHGRI_019324 [Rhododendron griersonianum]
MGCTASKLENEDTVRRCKDRRRLMKDAVYARHHLAAAHSDYCRSLRLTGSALYLFAAGEPLSVSDHTPAVLLRTPSSLSTSTTIPPPLPPRVIPSPHTPPPPPPPAFSPPSPTIASSKLPHILSAPPSRRHRKPPVKLPHILSESSPSNSARSHTFAPNNYTYNANANSTYSGTPSQASSVWNWENFYPPSPPDSEFFERRNRDDEKASTYSDNYHSNHQSKRNDHPIHDDDKASTYSGNYQKHHYSSNGQHDHHVHEDDKASTYSSNYQKHHYSDRQHGHHIHADDEEEATETEREREEVQYSDWNDHYNSTTSSSEEEEEEDYGGDRSEIGTRSRSNFGSSVHNEPKPVPAPAARYEKMSKSEKSDDAGSSARWNYGGGNGGGGGGSEMSDMRMVVRHRDLAEIVAALKEYFEKAAVAGEQVSEMLETGRAQLDRSFKQLKRTVYHSSGVFSNLSSSWTSKPPLAVKYRFEPGTIDVADGPKSLCSTLERLLAWEKKLYEEVKVFL